MTSDIAPAIVAIAEHYPERVLTNAELGERLGKSERWILERSVIVSRGNTLELGEWVAMPADAGAADPDTGTRDLGRERILEALEQTGWRVSGPRGAAHLLGLKPTTLEARMKRMGITRPSKGSQSS